MILLLRIHSSRAMDLTVPDYPVASPRLAVSAHRDAFGNFCHRLVAPKGQLQLSTRTIINDSGAADEVVISALQHDVNDLPDDVLVYLMASRYCETERLAAMAWKMFGQWPADWRRVQAICDFVHRHIAFGYEHASPTKTAWDTLHESKGVCRDYAHLAIALCRCMNIPARYCTGYLTDIGTPPPHGAMDFAAWFEAYLGGRWYTFDPRNNEPRIGRILMARGRDAVDVAITTAFGMNTLTSFTVFADEVRVSRRSAAVSVG